MFLKERIMRKVCLFILFAAFYFTSCIKDDEENNPESKIMPGDLLPSFDVTTIGGQVVSSEMLEGKVTFLVFFDTTCGDCRRELPLVEELWKEMKEESSFALWTISRAQTASVVSDYWNDNSFTMPVYIDNDRKAYSLFADMTIPRFYLADKSGTVRWIADTSLGVSVEQLENKIRNLLSE